MCAASQSDAIFPEIVLEFGIEANVSTQPILSGMRPHLNLAVICERHILEADGALTLFRIVDRFTITGTASEMPLSEVPFMLIVGFRSGEFRQSLDLGISIISPSKAKMQEMRIPANFEAPEEKGALSVGKIQLRVNEPGLYWIVIKLAEEEYTRIPLRIVYRRLPTIQTGS